MKKILSAILIITMLGGCTKLDLNPLSQGSSANWYSDETEISLALNDLYRTYLYETEVNLETERMTDNWTQRQAVHVFAAGAIASDWALAETVWLNAYKGISRANTILESLPRATGAVSAAKQKQFEGEAKFFRAVLYARLIFLYGDVPYYTSYLDIEKSFTLSRTPKAEILKNIYKDFDDAIAALPVSYSTSDLKRATKGAAMAFKARAALYNQDWATARDAAKACIDLKVYSLYPDFGEYFLVKTKNASETVFGIPQSTPLGFFWATTNFYPRTPGGSAVAQPSWELLCSFPCTDGLPIDKSPLYNPRNPFANRDPRCTYTIVEFNTAFLGFIYDPHPNSLTVTNTATGAKVSNKDNRAVDQFAAYNGLALKKGVDAEWSDDKMADFDIVIMRYADVLLMYAEAKIELGELDATAVNAINQVRARAYKVPVAATGSYPAVAIGSQEQLRTIVRTERRIETAWEDRRFDDIIRWRIAEKVLTKPIYGMLDPADLKTKVVTPNLWFFPGTPTIDADGSADFTAMAGTGLIKLLVARAFDKNKQYLWPIPSKEILINKNLVQNPGY